MAVSIENYLRELSYNYYLKNDSKEVTSIDSSVANLFGNLNKEFGARIKRKFVFGSYDRDTILPRKFDSKSDIDIIVVFNHTEFERTPETYRSWLKAFADKYYNDRYGSAVSKSFPTVTLKLNNINYDLVPAKEEINWMNSTPVISIPGEYGWRTTDPNDVKNKLIQANTRFNNIVRPIIRLLKAWNCNVGYPYDSYLLELQITGLWFFVPNIEPGFFYAVSQLSPDWNDPQSKKDKVNSLQYNVQKVKESLNVNDIESAKKWLFRVLPTP